MNTDCSVCVGYCNYIDAEIENVINSLPDHEYNELMFLLDVIDDHNRK